MQKITPFLWFDKRAEQAAKFYTSIFKRSKMGRVTRYGAAGPGRKGSVMTVSFTIEGTEFIALNGGPIYKITPAVSFVVDCKDQKELDYYWKKLTAGAKDVQCGWVTDKFGVAWQIVPRGLTDLVAGKDPEKSRRAMEAMFRMKKLDINKLRAAYEGRAPTRTRKV